MCLRGTSGRRLEGISLPLCPPVIRRDPKEIYQLLGIEQWGQLVHNSVTPLVCAHMKRRIVPAGPNSELQDDLSFPPPFHKQSKYLALADMFLCPDAIAEGTDKKVRSIDTGHYFRKLRKKRSA